MEYLFFTKELIVFYAAGNAGQDSSTSTESTSKNSVSVGSSQSTLYTSDIGFVSYFSSKGPTYDKRIKPDLDTLLCIMLLYSGLLDHHHPNRPQKPNFISRT